MATSRSRAGSAIARLIGFGSSVVLLAAAALAAIPAMIAASGEAAWGGIALGQAVGAIGAVGVLYGWGWYGPARVARATAMGRRTEFVESIYTRASLAVPASAISAAVAYGIAPSSPHFAAVSAVSTTTVGFTSQWYFAGVVRPLAFLTFETVPRVVGVLTGIALMHLGHSALVGPLFLAAGMALGFVLSTGWVLRETKQGAAGAPEVRRIFDILVSNRHGMIAAIGGAASSAIPQAVVSVMAPSIQPGFALAEKIYRQIGTATAPAVVVLQGWVPRASQSNRYRRASSALLLAGGISLVLGVVVWALAPHLVHWLGNGQAALAPGAAAIIAVCVSLALFEAVLSRAVLAAFGRLRICVRAMGAGAAVGFAIAVVGAHAQSISLALASFLGTLLVVVGIELVHYLALVAEQKPENA